MAPNDNDNVTVPSWDDIPESSRVLPAGFYTFEVEVLEKTLTKKGALMYKATYEVADGPHKGMPQYEYFNIGNDDDPGAKDPITWRNAIGARGLRDLFRATGIPMLTDMGKMQDAVKGQRFMQQVSTSVEPAKRRDGSDNPYGGRERNDLGKKFRMGERSADATGTGKGTVSQILASKRTSDDE